MLIASVASELAIARSMAAVSGCSAARSPAPTVRRDGALRSHEARLHSEARAEAENEQLHDLSGRRGALRHRRAKRSAENKEHDSDE
jgi:hypothetical protein